jgi:membrane protease YdiL (CAAX protease family)
MNHHDDNAGFDPNATSGPAPLDPPGDLRPDPDAKPELAAEPVFPAEEHEAATTSTSLDATDAAVEEARVALTAPIVLPGDPLAAAAYPPHATSTLPEDLRVSWSWPHLFLFLLFGFASLMVVQLAFVFYVSSKNAGHLSPKQMEQIFEDSPQLLVGTNVVWYGLLIFFLYLTLAVLRDAPFWRSLGWRKLKANPTTGKNDAWKYFFSGAGLAIFVAVASYSVKNTDHLPIQELFKNRTGALLLMGMAVLVAPLVEETVFRGYLYPLFAKSLGALPSVLLTGVLFGLMHGAQLGWTWGLVLLLSIVGVIFTFARSRTGTVLASFLMHLGYNSMIAVSSIIATRGFTHMPTP